MPTSYSTSENKKYDHVAYFGSHVELVPGENPPRRKRIRLIIIAVIAILALALIIGLAVGLTRRKDDQGSASGNQGSEDTQTTIPPAIGDWVDQPCSDPNITPQCPWTGVHPVLMISTDGFFTDYLRRNITPVLDKIRRCGVRTPFMRPIYPTATYNNHYTITTGLYPAFAGIMDNNMYDPFLNKSFTPTSEEALDPAWYSGEPLWVTAHRQGKKAASYFWGGRPVPISGILPDYFVPISSAPFEDRVNQVLDWLKMNETSRPDLILLYFEQPDSSGHNHGPNSLEVNEMIQQMDTAFHQLMNKLYENHLDNCVNILLLSDHGMTETTCDRQITFDYFLPGTDDMLIYSGTRGSVSGKLKRINESVVVQNENGKTAEEVVEALECKSSHLHVFTNKTIPVRLHYKGVRAGDVVLRANERWIISPKFTSPCLEDHGYDNIYESMNAVFMAHGPAFKQKFQAEPFENVELYNLVTEILNLEPAPNNGTAGTLDYMLKVNPQERVHEQSFNLANCSVLNNDRVLTCSCVGSVMPLITNGSGSFPFGAPTLESNMSICQLNGNHFSTFYSHDDKQPILASFMVTSDHVTMSEAQIDADYSVVTSCVFPDPRLSNLSNPDCMMYENSLTSIVRTQLFDLDLRTRPEYAKEVQLSSNMVPMYEGFKDGIWKFLRRLIKEYAQAYYAIHVSMGPVFDWNSDDRADELDVQKMFVNGNSGVPVPTHFYAILTKCSQRFQSISQCNESEIQTLTFILPHLNRTTNCLSHKEYLRDNIARIRDVEVLTGLRFLTNLERMIAARKRTALQTELWPTDLINPWKDLPCPRPDKYCDGKKPLLLISLDGFRADYLDRHLTPVIQRLADCGVHTPYMRSVYPTITFPNEYTIVTGLYPESHGVVSNNMYDETIDKIFSLGSETSMDPRWWHGEPIWNTAMKQGLKAATYFWPGSDVNISGMYPNIYRPYNGRAGFSARVYEVLDWLSVPVEERPDFLTLYFNEPDRAGHGNGPDSVRVNGQLETVDQLMDLLMTGLYERGLQDCVNIIITADHGMSHQSCDRKLMLDDYIPNIGDMLTFDRTMADIFPQFKKDGRSEASRQNVSKSVEDIVANLTCRESTMSVFTKSTLPRRHHYTNSHRIGDVIVKMADEWIVLKGSTSWCTGGNHGWDNTFKNMHALFLGYGPSFKVNYTSEPFENIELYNLMTDILNIYAAPNNGTKGSLSHMLRKESSNFPDEPQTTPSACARSTDPVMTFCDCLHQQNITLGIFLDNNDEILPFGIPSNTKGENQCLLHQEGSSSAFSETLNSPIWVSATINSQNKAHMLSDSTCVAKDNRVSYYDPADCHTDSDLVMVPLINPGINVDGKRAHLSSTMIPMYNGFRSGIWHYILNLISDYTMLYGDISVTSGPLYDFNYDGLLDNITDINRYIYNHTAHPVPVPTHIYVSLIKCKTEGQTFPCGGNVDLLSFILPNINHNPNCMSNKDYLRDNVARLRDIELMSGAQFMTSTDKWLAARLRTHLSEKLWDSSLFREWKDLPCPHQSLCQSDYRPLLLISLDGFRADYLLRNFTPTIGRLSQCGVHAPYMRSVYPTKTFPNHYSIVTGLYPESHGIIDNNMYDLNMEKRFRLGSKASFDERWWGGEPIWLTAKHQGLITATYFWPGSDVKIQGEYPDYYYKYDGSVSYYERVQQILKWMTLPKGERPDFITLYFDEPDLAGHRNGPDGAGMRSALERVDDTIALLMAGLVENNLHHCVNLVITADHGMAGVSCDRIVRLRDYVDYDYLSDNTWVWDGAFGRIANTYIYNRSSDNQISPAENPISTDGIFSNLTCASPHVDVFRKSTVPVRYHYSNNDRIDDIVLDVDADWLVARSYIRTCTGGNHGYDNKEKSMEALFLAYGPAFKWNLTIDAFENIELYNMFTEVLNITAVSNNGTSGSLNHILQSPQSHTGSTLFVTEVNGTMQYDNQAEFFAFVQSLQCQDVCDNMSSEMITSVYNKLDSFGSESTNVHNYPKLVQSDLSTTELTILQHPSYVVGYNKDMVGNVWVKQMVSSASMLKPMPVSCLIPDPRIQGYSNCLNISSEYQFGSLLLSVDNSDHVESLSILYTVMKQSFINEIWGPFQDLIGQWSMIYGDLEVIVGAVYDNNHDGLPDNPTLVGIHKVPSHIFTIISRCTETLTDECKTYQTFSVILPNDVIQNCKSFEAYLEDNECRIRDIELITGLQFYTDMPHDDAVSLRTYLPNGLWR